MSAEVMAILAALLKLGSSDGGQAVLVKLFADHGITVEKVTKAIDSLPAVKDTEEVSNG